MSKTIQHLEPDSLFELLFQFQWWPARQENYAVLRQHEERFHQHAWSISWESYSLDERRAFLERIPQWIGFSTSGHTGRPKLWLRHRQQLLAEIALLRELYDESVDGIITFAPLHHLYGFLSSLLLPLITGVPVWFQPVAQPSFITATELAHPMYIAIPAALTYLERETAALKAHRFVTVIHSTAWLPSAGLRLIEKLSPDVRLVELFGSTETGLVATRMRPDSQDASWHLARDVAFTKDYPSPIEDVPLAIQSPRIVWNEEGEVMKTWTLDDFVHVLDNRTFDFHGRRSSLVKVNGQRVHLKHIEELLHQAFPSRDLACVIRQDDLRGEAFDLLIEPDAHTPALPEIQRICAATLANFVQPRRIQIMQQIQRSATGKLLLHASISEEV